jgi:ABC-2 type transport system permease protein
VKQPSLAHVLQPKWRTALQRLREERASGGSGKLVVLIIVGGAFWVGVFGVLYMILRFLRQVEELGPLIPGKILGLILLSFIFILVLSNVITALSSFFLAKDLDLLVSAPVDWLRLYFAKLSETLLHSSWMVALMIVRNPACTKGVLFIPYAILAVIPMLILGGRRMRRDAGAGERLSGAPHAGSAVDHRPRRRGRPDSAVSHDSARAARPTRRISQPARLRDSARRPNIPLLAERVGIARHHGLSAKSDRPVAARAVVDDRCRVRDARRSPPRRALPPGIHQGTGGRGAIHPGHAVALDRGLAARVAASRLARVRAQGHQAVLPRHDSMEPADPAGGPLRRLPVQQVLAPPRRAGGFFYVNLVSFLNRGLADRTRLHRGPVHFRPSRSGASDGLRSSPLDLRALLWSKYSWARCRCSSLVLLTGLTNALLEVTPFMMIMVLATMAGLTLAIAAQALAFGTFYPQFETENAAQIPTSFGGLLFMMTTIALLAGVIVSLWQAVYQYVRAAYEGQPLIIDSWMFLWFAVAAALCATATIVPLRMARKKLETFEF